MENNVYADNMNRLSATELTSRGLLAVVVAGMTACDGGPSPIAQEFQARGLDYPVHVDSARPDVPKLVNPNEFGERQAPELEDLFASGWRSFLAVQHDEFARQHCSAAEAFVLSDPILFENGGHIDFGATLTCYGRAQPPHRAVWEEGGYWKVANVALFRTDDDTWTLDGWVY